MTTRSILTVLPLILVTACWPYLGGPYEDYVDGDGTEDPDSDPDRDTRDPDTEGTDDPDTDDPDTNSSGDGPVIAGWVEQTTVLGEEGWTDPEARQVFAVLAGLRSGASFNYTQGLPSSGSCVANWDRAGTLLDSLASVGLSSVEVTLPPDTVEMQPASDAPDALVGGLNDTSAYVSNATVTISGSASAGSLGGTLARTPSSFSVDEPAMDGETIPTLSFGAFDVGYSGTSSDTVVVGVTYIDSDNATVGFQDCLGRSGSATPNPLDLGLTLEDVAYAQVGVSRLRETTGTLSGSAGAEAEVVGVYTQVGLVLFQ